jgi:hypothetical protein
MNNITTQSSMTTTENILDTTTLWKRRDFLQEKYANLIESGAREQWEGFTGGGFTKDDYNDWEEDGFPLGLFSDDSEGGELYQLDCLHDYIGSWAKQTTMVREDHFVQYAQNWIEGLHDIPDCINSCIDWNKFADSLRHEWSTVDFMGEEYLVQN